MRKPDEALELAWLIATTEELLARLRARRTYATSGADDTLRLTRQQCLMVLTVHEHGSLTVNRLTRALGVNASSVSTMVERLVELGVLTREENPRDRREVLVRVAPSHQAAVEGLRRDYVHTVLDVFDRIGMESARGWGAVCRRIREALGGEQSFSNGRDPTRKREESKAVRSDEREAQQRAGSEGRRHEGKTEVWYGS